MQAANHSPIKEAFVRYRAALALAALGSLSLALYLFGSQIKDADEIKTFLLIAALQLTLFFIAAFIVWRARSSRLTFAVIILFAALFRLSVLFSQPYLSDDVYRYIWDGRVQASGVNPYRYIPADPQLARLRDERIYPHINRRDYAHTIYPPVAQMFFLMTTRFSESVVWMKAALVLCEAAAFAALIASLVSFGLPVQRIIVCAWHPLLVWEIAGSGHVDALMLAFIALALLARRTRKDATTGIALACATLVKFYPLVLFPAFSKRWNWRMPLAFALTIVLAYLPYLSVGAGAFGFLSGYASEEKLKTGENFFLKSLAQYLFGGIQIPNAVYALFVFVALAAVALWSLKREQSENDYIVRALILAASFTILLSPHYTWYFIWLAPFLCFAPLAPILYMTAASFALYGTWLGDAPVQMLALNSIIYAPTILLAALQLRRMRTNEEGERANLGTQGAATENQ